MASSEVECFGKFLKCLNMYPVAKIILRQITSLETLMALAQLAKENFSGPDRATIKRIIGMQGIY